MEGGLGTDSDGTERVNANPSLQILGVVMTLFDRRTILSRDIREQVSVVIYLTETRRHREII